MAIQIGSATHWASARPSNVCRWNNVGSFVKSWAPFLRGGRVFGHWKDWMFVDLVNESSDIRFRLFYHLFLKSTWTLFCNFTASTFSLVQKENWRRAKGNASVKIFCLCKCQLQFIVVYSHVFLSHPEGVPHLVLWCILALIIFHLRTIAINNHYAV